MQRLRLTLFLLLAAIPARSIDWTNVVPLTRVHSHNDYEQARPLWLALENGFCSIEADVHLRDNELLVAHDLSEIRPGRTLSKLYLEPLNALVWTNKGRVFPNGPSIILLVDVKTGAEQTYTALEKALQPYANILTRFKEGKIETNAITVIVSGNRAKEMMQNEPSRLAAYDGRTNDLDQNLAPSFCPLISDSWTSILSWKGEGPIPAAEKEKLQDLVKRTHAQGKLFRLWGTPDNPQVWSELYDAGVDLINTDKLKDLAAWMRERTLHGVKR